MDLQFAGGVRREGRIEGVVWGEELYLRGDLEGGGALAEEHEEFFLAVERRLVVDGVARVHDAVLGGVEGLAGEGGGGEATDGREGRVGGGGRVGPEGKTCCWGGEEEAGGD